MSKSTIEKVIVEFSDGVSKEFNFEVLRQKRRGETAKENFLGEGCVGDESLMVAYRGDTYIDEDGDRDGKLSMAVAHQGSGSFLAVIADNLAHSLAEHGDLVLLKALSDSIRAKVEKAAYEAVMEMLDDPDNSDKYFEKIVNHIDRMMGEKPDSDSLN